MTQGYRYFSIASRSLGDRFAAYFSGTALEPILA
jgi:hypothetical protein